MEWIETQPLPAECRNCVRQSCYNCDMAGKRWFLPEKEDLLLRRKFLIKTLLRTQKQIEEIDEKLAQKE